ncbi:MAG: pyridoxal-dependent decarboxylase, partial [Pirellulaceae bacterium]|nr:pyridoxal-dependent decarboxylase [Pirellulaceae bacterium]
ENLWLHVDAAYGGFFMLTEQGRAIMRGIEHADSVVLDPHKGMFLPYGTGCLLVKNRDDLLPAFSFTSEYMPEMSGDSNRQDSCEIMPELSRDHRGLRIWLPVMRHGIQVFETLLQEKLDLSAWAHSRLQNLKQSLTDTHPSVTLELGAQPQLSVLAFRLNDSERTPAQNDRLNQNWLDRINQDGAVMLSSTQLNGVIVLRICVLSFRTHIDRMQRALHIISESADAVLETSDAL